MRYYSRAGDLRLVEWVRDGVLDGPREEYDERGLLRRRVSFRTGRRHGVEQDWFANGSLSTEGVWVDDLPVGRWLHWDEVRRVLSAETYWIADGVLVGYLETTHDPETGRVTTQSLKTLQDDIWRGWRTRWHKNGVQAGLAEYVNDLREGRDVSWDPQGRKVGEGNREGDLRTGNWRFWDEAGALIDELQYVQGELVEGGSGG
jgi:antitoxin component YwqK of YwqJK toxin-antitoxin module